MEAVVKHPEVKGKVQVLDPWENYCCGYIFFLFSEFYFALLTYVSIFMNERMHLSEQHN